MFFRYFDFMHQRGWLSTRGTALDYLVVSTPAIIFAGVLFAILSLFR